ncbi:ACT domain-containing protein [Thermococcus paralvinellae]|uniref:Acetolactate synthase small subunit n=1 Tax=Thermococcus paralvinellae TaxID=582419 RepID=W0I7L2_9EURY|nr:ACT domain-containing protein [Thermococcus paralvinellae]AHF80747.1 acetolactate synthase small subunit [Thermococcus paralvinellae]
MRHYEIVRIKENGKIEIPLEFAYEIGLVKDSYFLIEIDTDLKEIHIERVALPGKKLVEIELVVEDKPGVLAKISGTLGRNKANILFSEAEELEGLGLAAIVAVVDVSGMKIDLEELKRELSEIEEVKEITLKVLE